MTERDEQVGRAVSIFRGGTSQSLVADEMRTRGWKWSQATVWSVEKGERPLRLLEAGDLADILGVQIGDFFGDKAAARREYEYHRLRILINNQFGSIRDATLTMLLARDQLRDLADLMGVEVPKSYEEVQDLDLKTSREKQLYFSLYDGNEAQQIRLAEHDYRMYKEDPENQTPSSSYRVKRTLEKIKDGIDSKEV